MALQWPEPVYVDGNFNIAEPISLPELSSPIRSTSAEYVLTQQWMQDRRSFQPAPLDIAHPSYAQVPDYSAFKLVSEGPRQDAGGGIVKWTRTYARVPDPHDEFESYAYSFIGFVGSWYVGSSFNTGGGTLVVSTGRPRITHVVTSRVQHDYFLTNTPSEIEILKGQRYYAGATGLASPALETDYISDDVGSVLATSPSLTEYNALVTQEAEIIAEDSRLSRWMGNIWLRQTRYVLAQ